MPAAALTMDQLTVDQSLVDAYLARVDRFCSNVSSFEDTLKEMMNNIKENVAERFRPEPVAEMVSETPVYQEPTVAPIQEAKVEQDVTTAEDIDLDALLADVNLGPEGLSM